MKEKKQIKKVIVTSSNDTKSTDRRHGHRFFTSEVKKNKRFCANAKVHSLPDTKLPESSVAHSLDNKNPLPKTVHRTFRQERMIILLFELFLLQDISVKKIKKHLYDRFKNTLRLLYPKLDLTQESRGITLAAFNAISDKIALIIEKCFKTKQPLFNSVNGRKVVTPQAARLINKIERLLSHYFDLMQEIPVDFGFRGPVADDSVEVRPCSLTRHG